MEPCVEKIAKKEPQKMNLKIQNATYKSRILKFEKPKNLLYIFCRNY